MFVHYSSRSKHETWLIEAHCAQRRGRFGNEHRRVCTARPRHVAQVFDGVHDENASRDLLRSFSVAAALDTSLTTLDGESRPLKEWTTTFHLASIVIDPYTNESAWILQTAARILRHFGGAATRVNFIVTAGPAEAKQFLGPLAKEFLTYVDPDRVMVKQLGLKALPAFVFIQGDGSVPASAEGWNPQEWRAVATHIAETVQWSAPHIPSAGDPGSFAGSPALG